MATLYPVALDLRGRRALVVGGGEVAQRKVEGLAGAGARVTVIAPQLTEALEAAAAAARIDRVPRAYQPGDVIGFDLVVSAVDDAVASAAITADARAHRVWVNAADDPPQCDFILPAVLRRGDLTVAVTTGGASPAMARAVRDVIARVITDDYGELTALAADVRRELRDRGERADAERWSLALDDELRALVRAGRRDEARDRLRRTLRPS